MIRIPLQISTELAAAIDEACDGHRNPAIEAWLWRIGDIRKAAARLGVEKPVRRKRGRPRNEETDTQCQE